MGKIGWQCLAIMIPFSFSPIEFGNRQSDLKMIINFPVSNLNGKIQNFLGLAFIKIAVGIN